MLLKLDFASDTPIYRQIRDQFVLGIAAGTLRAGERLPTIRALANETGVNVMTINKAYQLLKSEGCITTDRRGGTAVAGYSTAVSGGNIPSELRLSAANAKLAGVTRDKWLRLCKEAYDSLNEKECEQP
jgi:DNA-binding transcriptional regulator YhcF (GntR family)